MKENRKLQTIDGYLTTAYLLCLFAYLFSQIITEFHRTVWITIALYLMLGIGAIAGICKLIRWREYIHSKYGIVVILLLASYLFSIFMNYRYAFSTNIKHWIILTLAIIISYFYAGTENINKNIYLGIRILISVMNICVIISIIQLLMGYGKIEFYEYYHMKSGFIENRLWGVFIDPNHGSVLSVIVCYLCIYTIKKSNAMLKKLYYGFTIIIQMMYIAFSDSRTAQVCIAVSMTVYVFWIGLKKISKKKFINKCLVIVASCIIGVCCALLPKAIQTGYNMIIDVANLERKVNIEVCGEIQENVIEQIESNEGRIIKRAYDLEEDVSNQRFDIWKSGIEIFCKSPIYGVTLFGAREFAKKYVPNTYILRDKVYFSQFHNEVLDVAVAQGIIGLAIFVLMAILFIVYIIKNFVKEEQNYMAYLIGIIVLLCLCVKMMFQQGVMYMYNPDVEIFWMTLSYLVASIHMAEKNNNKKSYMSE